MFFSFLGGELLSFDVTVLLKVSGYKSVCKDRYLIVLVRTSKCEHTLQKSETRESEEERRGKHGVVSAHGILQYSAQYLYGLVSMGLFKN